MQTDGAYSGSCEIDGTCRK